MAVIFNSSLCAGVQDAFLRVSLGLIKMNKEIISDMSDEISLRPSIGTDIMDGEIDGQLRTDTSKQSDETVSGGESVGRCCSVV